MVDPRPRCGGGTVARVRDGVRRGFRPASREHCQHHLGGRCQRRRGEPGDHRCCRGRWPDRRATCGAQIAEDGSRDIQAAKREALGAIAAAEADGFEVGEDLSVTDTREVDENEIAARTLAAREHAEDIRWFAERLAQTDEFVGKRLQEKAVELEDIRFDGERDDRSDSSIQLVDNKIGPDAEDTPKGKNEEHPGGRTWQDMLLPPDTRDAPSAERSEGGPDAPTGEDAEPAGDRPPNPLDALAGKESGADADTPANLDEALFGPGAAPPPSVLDRLAAQARGEKTPADTPYTRSPLEAPIAAADPSMVDQQLGRVEAAQQAVAAAQAEVDAAAGQAVMLGPGAGPGRDVTEPLAQALFDARADLTTQTEILENLNQAAAEIGGTQVDVPELPENAGVQAFPAPPSAAEQAREGLTEFSHDISEKTFGIVPDVAEIADVYANWGEHSREEQLGAILDTAGSLPLPGAKPLSEALQHGLDAFTAGRHADDVVQQGIPHEVVDGPDAGSSPAVDQPGPAGSDGAGLGGHGAPGGDPAPFEVGNPIPAERPEFTLSNPVDYMSPELLALSERHLTGSGVTVLGPFTPAGGGPSYIDVAENTGASYFDLGDAWYSYTPTQQLAANQHVLDVAITNQDTIKLSVPFYEIRPDTYTGAELRYILDRGYQRIDDTTFVPKG